MRYRITVHTTETVRSEQVLEVEARTAKEAKRIAEEERDAWRNGHDGPRIKIVEAEDVVDSDLESLEYEVDEKS